MNCISTNAAIRDHKHDNVKYSVYTLCDKTDFQQITRSKTFANDIASNDQIFNTAREVLDSIFVQGNRIRLLGITLSNLRQPDDPEQLDNNQLTLHFN